ncbi:glycosyltransferase family 4 protein [Enterobacter cloacae]|uniref:glycosyltransferase family 4 protein n=1 Tax=Enterobacter cloacae TaxID=550 RepID=UPI0002680108|nr:glycosyltransferase family 4 protein [Enterobacter cloacae]AFM60745.1 glycosyltransferase [Enterobacter cloacae subsp. dissolvens SDM]MBE1252386.1 glycosyltransferase family 4 protein [Enterobacter cloacae]
MKISITANTSWYIYNFRKNTIRALREKGYEVFAICPDDEYQDKLEKLGCTLIVIPMQRWGKNPLSDLKTLFAFYKVFKQYKINLTLNFTPKNNIYATLAASVLNIKVINNIAGLGVVFIENGFFSKLVSFLYKTSQKKADYIFFQNEEDRDLFVKMGVITDNCSDRLPGSGVDLTRFNYSPIRNEKTIKFLLVARLIAEKGVYHFVEAARVLKSVYPNLEFFLLGPIDKSSASAVSIDEINEWERLGLITYLGFTDSVEDHLLNADCIVLPSYYREGVPKSLLEAAAIGRPIITTDNIGCREVVDNGFNGFLCKPNSTSSLVESINKFLSLDFEHKVEMGLKSRRKIEKEFDEQIVINKYQSVIERVLK